MIKKILIVNKEDESGEVVSKVKRMDTVSLTLRKLKCFKKSGQVSFRYLYRFDELPSNAPSNSVIVPTTDVQV